MNAETSSTIFQFTLEEISDLSECIKCNGGLYQALVAFNHKAKRSPSELLHLFLPMAEKISRGESILEQIAQSTEPGSTPA